MDQVIGEKTIKTATDGIKDTLFSYLNSINRSYLDQDELKISAGIQLRPRKKGVAVTFSISFFEKKIKDGDTVFVDEKQEQLPFE